jgi:hypothetical protein
MRKGEGSRGYQNWAVGSPLSVGVERGWLRVSGSPARDSSSLVANWGGKREGKSGGDPGPFIEANREAFDGRNQRRSRAFYRSKRGSF